MPVRSGAERTLIARQREAAERLRREVIGEGGAARHPYHRALARQLRGRPERVDLHDLLGACASADIVYIGDFHALPAAQRFAARVVSALAERGPLALGIEFVYTRQQELLDRRQRGDLGDDEFLRRIHYREEWGYPWDGFRALLDAARDAGVSVHALDAPPRGGTDRLSRRDVHAAARIASMRTRQPGTRLIVFFGESHLARGHLPRHVRARLKRHCMASRDLFVFQDPDPAYWWFVGRGEGVPGAARLAEDTFAVFHTTPLAKYEAFRGVLERWSRDLPSEDEADFTPAVHHLLSVLTEWLGIDPARQRVMHLEGWIESLADAYPEVYSGSEAEDLLAAILAEHGRSREEVGEARKRLAESGALYEPRSNTFFLARYLPGRAAGEGARFLRTALTGRLFALPDEEGADGLSKVYGATYNEALAHLGARVVDPTGDSAEGRSSLSAGGPEAFVDERRRWLEAHRKLAPGKLPRLPSELLERLESSRALRRGLARVLGRHLGGVLFDRVRRGSLGTRELRALFSKPLRPSRIPRFVLDLLTSGDRG